MNKTQYDYLIVGSGLFGSIIAYRLKQYGYKVLVIDRRSHIGGNVYTELENNIHIHKYGPHIFHTNDKIVWDFMNKFCEFEQFVYSPIAIGPDKNIYNLPFNMNTIQQVYGFRLPKEAKHYLDKFKIDNPQNVEEIGISSLGEKMYKLLVKEYTEKQWGKKCNELKPFVLNRIPIRFEYNNNYFNDKYQGIPINGYTYIIFQLLEGIEIHLNTPYNHDMHYNIADKIIYCGPIDELCNYELGELEWRGLKFEKKYDYIDYGCVVTNFCSHDKPYTRVINHKMFLKDTKNLPYNICSIEYPSNWENEDDKYYPINNDKNDTLYNDYLNLINNKYPKIIMGGRLGTYKYLNMDDVVKQALDFNIS